MNKADRDRIDRIQQGIAKARRWALGLPGSHLASLVPEYIGQARARIRDIERKAKAKR